MNNPDDQDYETWSLDVWLPEDIEQLLRSRDQRCAEIDRLRAELAAAQAITARVRKILRASNSTMEAYYAITAAVGEEQP